MAGIGVMQMGLDEYLNHTVSGFHTGGGVVEGCPGIPPSLNPPSPE